jgi:hypothetical protein
LSLPAESLIGNLPYVPLASPDHLRAAHPDAG